MSRLTLALGLALLVVEMSVAVALVLTSDHDSNRSISIGLAATAGAAFVLSGLVALARRPENRTGVYMAAVGYLWFLGALSESNSPWVYTVGWIIGSLAFGPLTALALVHPTGRFGSRFESMVPWITVGAFVSLSTLVLLVDPTPDPSCDGCPTNKLLVTNAPGLGQAIEAIETIVGIGIALLIAGLMARRWRRASHTLRRTLKPVFIALAAMIAAIVLQAFLGQAVSEHVATLLSPVFLVTFAAVPLAFLYGVLRTRLARSSIVEVVVALQEGAPLVDALASTLDDPSLEILYRLPGTPQWVDNEGVRVPEPVTTTERSVTFIERAGLPIAALVHDHALDENRELVEAVAAATGLSLDNERLTAGLRAQYTFLETVTDTAPSLLVNVDIQGRIVNQNQSAIAVAGVDDQELVRGRFFWDVFIDPSERDDVIERFEALAPEFSAAEYENAFTNARGETRVVYWRTAPVLDEDGTVVSIIAGGLDITEREQLAAEKELEREFLNAIANNAPSLLALIDDTGRVADRATNISFERTLGYDAEETGSHTFWEKYVDPDDVDEARRNIERVFAGESMHELDSHWLTRSGDRVVIAWTCTPLPQLDERHLFLISGVDVTERKQRELDLKRAHDFQSATANSIPTLLVLVDEKGVVTEHGANTSFKRVLGYDDGEVDRRCIWEVLVPESDRAEMMAAFRRSTAGAPGSIESRWTTRGGDIRLVEWTTVQRIGAGGERQYLICANDVTERKRFEDEIVASRARIVRAEDEARQRLERNLHDGAQQRLVALSVSLRLVESRLREQPDEASALLTGARAELTHALEELRELARGIHPAVLTDRGLGPALEALVQRTPLPVVLEAPLRRLSPAVEAAAYYVVAESLTNVTKYGSASSAEVRVAASNGSLVVTVEDNGVGGADPTRGSGLRGLADRVAALAGTFSVDSPDGGGTRVTAEIPLDDSTR